MKKSIIYYLTTVILGSVITPFIITYPYLNKITEYFLFCLLYSSIGALIPYWGTVAYIKYKKQRASYFRLLLITLCCYLFIGIILSLFSEGSIAGFIVLSYFSIPYWIIALLITFINQKNTLIEPNPHHII